MHTSLSKYPPVRSIGVIGDTMQQGAQCFRLTYHNEFLVALDLVRICQQAMSPDVPSDFFGSV
jgi:hypothetical protein